MLCASLVLKVRGGGPRGPSYPIARGGAGRYPDFRRCRTPERKGPSLMPMESLACLNGELMPVDEARVPVWDRGFLFGDAVYEVFRLYGGRCWLEAEHLARLRRSLNALDFAPYD